MMQKQFTDKTSKAAKRAFISAVIFLIYGIFIFLAGFFMRVGGMLGCDAVVSFAGCPLPNLYYGFGELFFGLLVGILTMILGLTIPIVWTVANGILIVVGWKQQDDRKNLLIASLALSGLAFLICLGAVAVTFLSY